MSEVLLHRKSRGSVSVYGIHTFNKSKGLNVAIFNLVNCQSDTLFKILYNSLIGVFVVFRVLNPVEIYIFKNITCMNKRNDLYIHHFRCVFLLFKSSRILNMLNIYKSSTPPPPPHPPKQNKNFFKKKKKKKKTKKQSSNFTNKINPQFFFNVQIRVYTK